MRQTNYHLFDFMDFDPALEREEWLWKCHEVISVSEKNGDIILDIPFQRQLHQEDMAPDIGSLPEAYTLVIRAYSDKILRLFISMTDDSMTDESLMLQMDESLTGMPLKVCNDNGLYIITDSEGKTRATIDTRPYKLDRWSSLQPDPQPTTRLTLYPDGDMDKPVALSDDHFSPPRYDALPLGYVMTENGHVERATISFQCEADEVFCGTGERFRKIDLSGQSFFLKNQDGQGVNNRRCYKNIPFYLSSRMYGAFYHTSDYCKLSLADHSTRSVQFLNDRATIDVFLIGGDTPEQVLRGYRQLTGFPSVPPLWSYGVWMSRMTYFSADEVEEICHRLREEHYPCDVIHLDTGWFRTDWLCEWKFNPERFPDPMAFIKRLADDGFKVSLWQLPYVAAGAEQIDEARNNGYIGRLLKEQASEGSNFSTLDYAGTIDFTNPEATEWYKGLLRELLEMGVKCIKTDFGENIHMDAEYKNMTPEQLNNIYALLYQKAAYEVTKEVTGDGIVWARAAWAGCQRFPLHWGGDSEHSWAGLAGSLKGGLHFGLSGFAFWSHDVPGFHSTPNFMNSPLDEELYVRWTQFGVFTSHIRYHGTCKREPWHYPNISPIIKKWWMLRYRLIPYIEEQGRKCAKTGYPMIRPLFMHNQQDRTCWHIDDEYYFGDTFLVAPVMQPGGKRDIYLPEGMWVNFFTGERLDGGRWYYDVDTILDHAPVFVRPGDMIRVYMDDVESTDDMDLSKSVLLDITRNYKGLQF
ncbi:MAG: alpha-xylosidase [Prevotella sp.]|nr:alpha-xylosidase [Prevotella sp.]